MSLAVDRPRVFLVKAAPQPQRPLAALPLEEQEGDLLNRLLEASLVPNQSLDLLQAPNLPRMPDL